MTWLDPFSVGQTAVRAGVARLTTMVQAAEIIVSAAAKYGTQPSNQNQRLNGRAQVQRSWLGFLIPCLPPRR
jgi:hypothetical protein